MGNKSSSEQERSEESATFIPVSEVGARIQNFTAKFNDDKLHSVCDYVLKDAPMEIIISFSYRDQGWGNCKGAVYFKVVRPSSEAEIFFKRLGDLAAHHEQSVEVSFNLSTEPQLNEMLRDDKCEILCISGSGGGHELTITNLTLTINYKVGSVCSLHPPVPVGHTVSLPSRISVSGVRSMPAMTEYDRSPAFIPNLSAHPSEFIRSVWSKQHTPLPEYMKAHSMIALEPHWILHTRLLRHLGAIKRELRSDRSIESRIRSDFDNILLQAISKAYPNCSSPRSQQDITTGCGIFNTISPFYSNLRWRKSFFAYSLQKFCEFEDQDTIVAKLSEVCDRAHRCQSAQRQAFNILICAAQRNLKDGDQNLDLLTREGALTRFYECMEDYLDDHKERAFKSSFMEPARFYYDTVHNHMGRDHVNVHGLNWYLALLHATLGMQLPLMPALSDPDVLSVIDFWSGLTDSAWEHFSEPANFGLDFEGIKALKNNSGSFIRKRVTDGQIPEGHHHRMPKVLGNAAVDSSPRNTLMRQQLAPYLERFAFFFSRDFFIQKSFETLNSEMKPEHVGFRTAAETLFKLYKAEFGYEEDSLVEHCYTDDMFTTLDIDKTERFYAWLRVTKAVVEPAVSDSKLSNSECLVCLEQKPDIEVIVHCGGTQGDVSGHVMCGDCRANYDKNYCPVCQGPIASPQEQMVEQFVETMVNYFISGNTEANYLASAIEEWQMFETMSELSPQAIEHAADLLLRNPKFESFFCRAVDSHCEWLRDAAGIWFRLYSLYTHSDLLANLPIRVSACLVESMEPIFAGIEHGEPAQLHGHVLGALYQQVLSAWLCAYSVGKLVEANGALRMLVQRVGHAITAYLRSKNTQPAKYKLKGEFKERVYSEVMQLAQVPIWGSAAEDIVWEHFMK